MNNLFTFTVEESNLLCIFQSKTREQAIKDIKSILKYQYDEDMEELCRNVIGKLEKISDEEYVQLELQAAD